MYIRGRGQEGHGMEGVTGLKSLGVRDLTYRLAFLATTVTPTDPQVDWLTRLLSPLLISLSPSPLRPHILFSLLLLPSPLPLPIPPTPPYLTHFLLTPSHHPPPPPPSLPHSLVLARSGAMM